MTREELKRAFNEQCPVIHNGIEYKQISALIYRRNPGGRGLIVQAELLDRTGHSVTIAPPDRIERGTSRETAI